ncbi:hypothetical protein B5M47_03995 [candidate division CPR3 bacterium 4484_211]|uniref:Uncharacterized protein n=1 Tax=candidate division CPR3 bacterium 4484_211 TaxID=1968527 RepID=A0A1W9NW41_UNCC3|nr:MAG: hypothetical protein B5M47_03995 [candidate division CPR3 bacterium 4484_211]
MKGTAKKIRELLKIVRVWPVEGIKELSEAVGVDRHSANYTVRDFLRRGELVVENGMYRYRDRPKNKLIDKIWRAWRYCPQWTVNEIAQLVEANREIVMLYTRLYCRAGYVEKIGRKKTQFGYEAVYRLKDRNNLKERPCIGKRC